MCFSDFPFPEHYPQYMSHKQYHQYLKEYAHHFDIMKHIQFNTSVLSVKQTPDYAETGRWEVTTKTQNDKVERHIFGGVFICVGAFRKPFYPDIKGMDIFKGEKVHMLDYRQLDIFTNKTVLVIGI